MKTLLKIALVLSVLTSKAQNQYVDSKNGFCDFKLGDDFSKISKSCTKSSNADKIYFYDGLTCRNAFGYKVESISFIVEKNRIEEIEIHIETLTSDEMFDISKQAENLFGKASTKERKVEVDLTSFVHIWKGQKTDFVLCLGIVHNKGLDDKRAKAIFIVTKSKGDGF